MAAETFKIRSFEQFFPTGDGKPMLSIVGQIENQRFVVSVLGQRVGLETVEVGQDARGLFALVVAQKAPLVDGFIFEAGVEYEEDEEPGGFVSVFIDGDLRDEAKSRLAQQGIDPDRAIILILRERVFTVYFNSAGIVDGGVAVGVPAAGKTSLN